MDKPPENDPNRSTRQEIVEGILGPDEDFLETAHSEEFLLAFGIEPTTLLVELKEHLEGRARQHQSEQGAVPPSISGALRTIRQRVKSSNPMNIDPASHLDLLLAGALAGARPAGPIARSFRREGDDELCDEDEKLLDDLEAELDQPDEVK
ncbi:MAG: hypothetical protein AABN95_15325 [Acidobacteriota bacterium]